MKKPTINEIRAWLDENVMKYPDPDRVTLYGFIINWEDFSGRFKIKLDQVELPFEFKFSPEASGKPTLFLPMLHSPLGIPASYPAISMTDKTRGAIERALKELIPRIHAFGINQLTGKEVTSNSPISERVLDVQQLELVKSTILGKEHVFKV